jgi:hypothetical protein
MTPRTRLHLSLAIVFISMIFGFLVLWERDLAADVVLWYVPTVITMILFIDLWKRDT